MNRVLVSGSLAYDRIMDFPGEFKDHFLPDKLHSISVSFAVAAPVEQLGGTGGNIAYNLALLEETAEILGTAGNDFLHYRQRLLGLGIDPESIDIVQDLPTSAAFIITDAKDNQISAFSGAAGFRPYSRPVETARYAAAIVSAGNVENMVSVPEACRAGGLPFFYDPGQQIVALSKEQIEAGLTGAAAVFGNDYEIGLIKEKTGLDEAGLLSESEAVVITYGEQGSRILTRDGETRVPSVHAEHVLDPTGAGDAYRAGFMKGYLAKLPLPVCGKLGSVAGAYAVERYGTQNHEYSLDDFRNRYRAAYDEACPV
ncbi:MAG: carbohydrate kinase family protein [Patescibacteria group bacterium]|nr:carbohydrate kinase family protein [Patescibacteria group bacterium]